MSIPLKVKRTGTNTDGLGEITPADTVEWGTDDRPIANSGDIVQHDDILDGGGLLLTSILPPLSITTPYPVASQAAMLALTAEVGDVAIRSDNGKSYILAASPASVLGNWLELTAPGAVTSVNGYTGVVVLTATDVGALTQAAADARYVLIACTGDSTVGASGNVTIAADSDANAAGAIILATAGTAKFTVTNTGVLQAGVSNTTGAAPGAIVLPNAVSLWGANAANSAPYRLISLDATDFVRVDQDARGTQFGGPIATGGSPVTFRNFSLLATLTGNATQVGLWAHPTSDSTGTTVAAAIDARVTAQAGVYNIADIYGVHILNPNLGAGVTATRVTGILIDNLATGGTNTAIQTNGAAGVIFGGTLKVAGVSAFGGAALDTTKFARFENTSALLTGTTQWGQYTDMFVNSSATVAGIGVYSKVDTQAAAFTVADTYGVYVANGSKGAGSTITVSTGLLIEDQTRGTTNWAIRTLGAAKSSFAGGITLGATGITFSDASTLTTAPGSTADNVNIAGVFFNVDSDASDATNVDSFIWGRDRVATAGGTTLMTLNASGYLLLGTTLTTSVAAFDIVIPRGNYLRSVNNAGTDTKPLIGLDTTDTVLLGTANVRVQSGIFLVNTTVTTSASSGDIVVAFQRGLRIVNSGTTNAYLAIDRTNIGSTQALRIEASVVSVIAFGTPGYIDDATLGDSVYQNGMALRWANGAGTATAKVLTMNNTNDVALNGTNSLALQTAATERLKIDAAGNVLLWAGAGLGSGVLVVSIHNATTDPTTNPVAGGILYASGGALKWRGSGGTVTTIAAA